MAYEIEGKLLEVCTCNVLCPCWIGEDPDGGKCDSALAWHIDGGSIEGVDVTGRTVALSVHIPGNVLVPKSWKAAVFVDDGATDEQQAELLKVFTGQLGGAIADLAGLIGEVVSRRACADHLHGRGRARATHHRDDRRRRPDPLHRRDRQPDRSFRRPSSRPSPGRPSIAAKTDHFTRDGDPHGLPNVDAKGRNALQGHFRFAA